MKSIYGANFRTSQNADGITKYVCTQIAQTEILSQMRKTKRKIQKINLNKQMRWGKTSQT